MKKFLSLVLALVMTMSLVTVSAGAADFTDEKDIKYVEAVEVLDLVGILGGYPDGSFQPTKVLTRAEAAKIIAYTTLGSDIADELSTAVAPFTDIAADNWAAGYIAECVDKGILAGMGDGSFAPNAELTGNAYLKMLLTAVGYDAQVEGLTGNNWVNNVTRLTKKLKLTSGIDGFVGNAKVTRDVAAKLTWNAMQLEQVTYANAGGTTITLPGDIVIDTTAGGEKEYSASIAEEVYGMKKEEGKDDFGREGVKWVYDDEKTALIVEAADYVLVAEEAYATLGKMIEDLELEDEITADDELEDIAIGTVVELWVNDDEEITDVITYSYTIDTIVDVAEIDDEEDLYDCGATVEYEFEELDGKFVDALDCDEKNCKTCKGYEAIGEWEEDDVVLLTINEDGEAVEFAEVETIVGEVTKSGDGYVRIDGEKYYTALEVPFEKEYTFYLDANGIIIAAEPGDATSDDEDEEKEYVYVLKAQADEGAESDLFNDAEDAAAKVKVMYVDGEVEVVDYALYEDDDENVVYDLDGKEEIELDADEFKKISGWYAYEMDGGEIVLTEKMDVEDITVSNERKWAGDLCASADTELVLLDKDGVYETTTGRTNFPKAEKAETYEDALVVLDGKTVVAIYVYQKTWESEAETIDVAMFVELGEETKDGTEAIFYVAGEEETYVVADTKALTDAGLLFEIEIDDDIATVKALTEADEAIVAGEVTFVDGEYFEVDGEGIDMVDDCAVYQVNKAGEKVSDGELTKGKNVVVILDSEGDAVEIFQYKGDILAW